jgi:hypothetical protein
MGSGVIFDVARRLGRENDARPPYRTVSESAGVVRNPTLILALL